MRQFLWKWAIFIVLNAILAFAAVTFFEGHVTGSGGGIIALAGAGILLVMVVGALLYLRLGGNELNGFSVAIIVIIVLGMIVIGAVGWGWLQSAVETGWRFWGAAGALPAISALEVGVGHAGRPRLDED